MTVQRTFVAAMVALAALWVACGDRGSGAPCKSDFECTTGEKCDLATSSCVPGGSAAPDASSSTSVPPDAAENSEPPDASVPPDAGASTDAGQPDAAAPGPDAGPAPTVHATGLANYIVNQSAFRTVQNIVYGFAAESVRTSVKCKASSGNFCLVNGYPYDVNVRSMNAGSVDFVDRGGSALATLPYDARLLLYPMVEKNVSSPPAVGGSFRAAGFGNIPPFSTPFDTFASTPTISFPNVSQSTPPSVNRFNGFTVAWSTTGALKEVRVALSEIDTTTQTELQTVFALAADSGQFSFNTPLLQNLRSGSTGVLRIDRISTVTANGTNPPGSVMTYVVSSARGVVTIK